MPSLAVRSYSPFSASGLNATLNPDNFASQARARIVNKATAVLILLHKAITLCGITRRVRVRNIWVMQHRRPQSVVRTTRP